LTVDFGVAGVGEGFGTWAVTVTITSRTKHTKNEILIRRELREIICVYQTTQVYFDPLIGFPPLSALLIAPV
jgi:hypothetical protein